MTTLANILNSAVVGAQLRLDCSLSPAPVCIGVELYVWDEGTVGTAILVAVTSSESSVFDGLSARVRVPQWMLDPVNVDVHDTSVGPVYLPLV